MTQRKAYFISNNLELVNIGYMVGPAGSGKSHMTAALYEYMNLADFDVVTMNLDPGVIRLPYAPDIDVRQFVSLEEIIDKYDLGPNGGLIAAMDQVALNFDLVMKEMEEYSPEYLLVDLPGQIEVFTFRSSGPVIINELAHGNQLGGIFLIDPTLSSSASSFVSILLFGLSITYRLNTAMNYMISKSDLLSIDQVNKIQDWSTDTEFLFQDLLNEKSVLSSELSRRIGEVIRDQGVFGEFPLISAETNSNLDIVMGLLERNWGSEDVLH